MAYPIISTLKVKYPKSSTEILYRYVIGTERKAVNYSFVDSIRKQENISLGMTLAMISHTEILKKNTQKL